MSLSKTHCENCFRRIGVFWQLPHDPLLSAAGCCLMIHCPRRLAASSRSAALGGWLLPHGPLLSAAGCCLTVCSSWWLTAASHFVALGGWLLPHCLLLLAADCCLVILQFLPAPLPRVDAVSRRNQTPHLTPLKSVASHKCLGRAVAIGTWVVVVIVHRSQLTKAFISEKITEMERCAPALPLWTGSQQEVCQPDWIHSQFGWVSLTPALVQSATTSHNH
jgi:hypothetical protein